MYNIRKMTIDTHELIDYLIINNIPYNSLLIIKTTVPSTISKETLDDRVSEIVTSPITFEVDGHKHVIQWTKYKQGNYFTSHPYHSDILDVHADVLSSTLTKEFKKHFNGSSLSADVYYAPK